MENNENNALQEREAPKADSTVEPLKIKRKPKMKQLNKTEDVVKVDLDKPVEPEKNETTKQDTDNKTDDTRVVTESKDAEPVQEQKEVQPEKETQEQAVLEEVTEEKVEKKEEVIEEPAAEVNSTEKQLPENIQKLLDFMEETGGDINDYVKLNQDYSNLDDQDLLFEYYKQTKPHLSNDEINFLMQDTFAYDEEIDEEKDIRRKKIALKEQVASAKSHLDGQKSRYYEEIKAGSKLTPEQQKAIDFFNRYNKESEMTQKAAQENSKLFTQKTNQVFNENFKGFEYEVGNKRFRFNVNNVEEVKQAQSDLNNFTKKFLDEKMSLVDAEGYHKSLYTAMNADTIARHFYEQGKADAIKESVAKSKNIDMNPRQSHNEINVGGIKARVLGDNSSDFKFKINNKK